MDSHHAEILELIRKKSGTPTQHTFLDSYVGNTHPRYPINAPALRRIAKDWMREHRLMTAEQLATVLTNLVNGVSGTEKVMTGILLDNSTKAQRGFDPWHFDRWLDHLVGWAEVDAVCTGKYCITEIPANITTWKKILRHLCTSDNINKRRASIVFLCSPLSQNGDPRLAAIAFANVRKLSREKEVIITRAISWVLRSMVKHHKKALQLFLKDHGKSLPSVAVRETIIKLKTGTKTKRKKK